MPPEMMGPLEKRKYLGVVGAGVSLGMKGIWVLATEKNTS
jgi:hypothetical protein